MTTFSFQQSVQSSLKYFNGDQLAADVFVGKYALFNPKTAEYLEQTPQDMHIRLSNEFVRIENKFPNPLSLEEVQGSFERWEIVAQGSPMAGIGNPYQLMSIGNCFVLPAPQDSYAGICRIDQEEAQIMKRRGGVGFDISTIRPRGSYTENAAKTTDGIGVFMERFSNTCREVAQGGRRGALMLSISVHHPEIRTFIQIKKDLKKVTGANISVRVTDEFMQAVKDGANVDLRFPVENGDVYETVKAQEIWDLIKESAHSAAEPGILFWDTVQRNTPADIYKHEGFASVSTNPCGEIVLSPYDSCRLLLINVIKFVKDPFTSKATFDWKAFKRAARVAQRLMDDIVELELECVDRILAKIDSDPEDPYTKTFERKLWDEIRRKAVLGRRTGTGVTAIGDALAALGVRYGSEESISTVEEIYKTLAQGCYEETITLAEERGAFPVYDYTKEKDHRYLNQIIGSLDQEYQTKYRKFGRRNIALTTTAPAGSVSILTQTTSGIEPAFMLKYDRWKKVNPGEKDVKVDRVDQVGDSWQKFTVYHHGFRKWMDISGKTEISDSPYHLATANEIDWKASVKLQAAAQKWVDHAISKTCNLPKDVSLDIVSDCYMLAWETGCKGFTVYRDGSRDGVLTSGDEEGTQTAKFHTNSAPKRPDELECEVHRANVAGETWTIFLGLMDGKPYEIMGGLSKYIDLPKKIKSGFIRKNRKKSGNSYDFVAHRDSEDEILVKDLASAFENPSYGSFTRTISLALRHGTPVQYVVEQLQKGDKDSDLFSFSKVMARVLKNKIADGTKITAKCKECDSENIEYREGCATCMSCGYSKCG